MNNFISIRSEPKEKKSVESLYHASLPSYACAGGFLVEDVEYRRETKRKPVEEFSDDEDLGLRAGSSSAGGFIASNFSELDGVICSECGKPFATSYLLVYFAYPVCDSCKNMEEKHKLITRTEAKTEYLLKDSDLDVRKPRMKFLSKKNPHNPRWGDMKLYLKIQVEKRALEIWGSLDKLEEAKEERDRNKEDLKRKRFDKKIKQLRKHVRNDLYKKPVTSHEHEYGEEMKDNTDQSFFRICRSCNQKYVYEKL